MRKAISFIICCFIPSKEIRKRVRKRIVTPNLTREVMLEDRCGGNFKEYISENRMSEKLIELKRGLDFESAWWVDVLYERILQLPTVSYFNEKLFYLYEKHEIRTEQERQMLGGFKKSLSSLKKKYHFRKYLPEVVFAHHGLKAMPGSVLNYIAGKDFLDLGAFIGDSAVVLSEYGPRKIYSFEGDRKTADRLRRTLKKNKVDQSKIEVVENFVGLEEKGIVVDSFVREKNLTIGLIKADIEGCEYRMVEQAIETIKRDLPVLVLAIYHTPKDFFELKPFLENQVPDYEFHITKLSAKHSSIAEATLIAHPKDLQK